MIVLTDAATHNSIYLVVIPDLAVTTERYKPDIHSLRYASATNVTASGRTFVVAESPLEVLDLYDRHLEGVNARARAARRLEARDHPPA